MAAKKTLRRVLRLLAISAKIDLMWLLRDTKFALLCMIGDVAINLATVSGMFLIALRFGGIGGMSADEVLFMMGYSTMVTGLFSLFGSGNNIHISRIIGRGQLEHLFMQPLSLPMQLLTSGFGPFTGSSNLLSGIVLLAVAAGRIGLHATPQWLLALFAQLAATMAIIIGRSYLASTLAFYAPVAAEEISSTVIDDSWVLGTFPLSGMPRFITLPLLTILPEGLMAWLPTLILLGKAPEAYLTYYPMIFALMLALVTTYAFRKGMKHYVQKGTNRYVPFGYRR